MTAQPLPTLSLSFSAASTVGETARVGLLGGKGAALARMVTLGLPVPPGFTLTTAACHRYLADGWSSDLQDAVAEGLDELQSSSGRRVGDPSSPLLLSVRSGAPVSMPGMMDTVLNAGMTDEVADRLGVAARDARFGWDTHRRFTQSYASVVVSAAVDALRAFGVSHLDTPLSPERIWGAINRTAGADG